MIAPSTLGSFNSNVASGSSYQATSWLCSAPNAPFEVSVDEVGQSSPTRVKVTDTNVAPTTLTSAPIGSSIWPPYAGASWVYPTLHRLATHLPALSATSTNFGAAQSPDGQAKAMRHWCFGDGVLPAPQSPRSTPCAAFGLMDTSEAQFSDSRPRPSRTPRVSSWRPPWPASRRPPPDSPPARLRISSCPAGTYSVNYADTNPAAYPMANLTYAIVPTSTLSYTRARPSRPS